ATYIVRAAWSSDPRPLFDTLAARILGTSGAPPGERPTVLAQTTSSIAAYRAYLEGSAALQRLQLDSAQLLLERAVALDSGFALAYQHLLDALARCAGGDGSAAFHLCVRDSAAYGAPDELSRRFGARTVARWRDEARATQIQSARAWVAAVPSSWRPRQMLLDVLYSQRRYDEVVREARTMDRLGWQAEAAFFKGMALFGL